MYLKLNIGYNLINSFLSGTFSKEWDMRVSLFQYEKYTDISDVLQLYKTNLSLFNEGIDLFNAEFQNIKTESQIEKQNELILETIMREYWLPPLLEFLKNW